MMEERTILIRLKQVFATVCDKIGKDKLNQIGYQMGIVALFGYEPHEWEVDHTFAGEKEIDLDTFEKVVLRKLSYFKNEHYIREMFAAFDIDWKGYITIKDVKRAWTKTRSRFSWYVMEECFYDICMDDETTIDYTQFRNLVMADPNEYCQMFTWKWIT